MLALVRVALLPRSQASAGRSSKRLSRDFSASRLRAAMLALCGHAIVGWAVCATEEGVLDVWHVHAIVLGELYTYMCGSGCGAAAVRIARSRSVSNALVREKCSEARRATRVCRMCVTHHRMLRMVL